MHVTWQTEPFALISFDCVSFSSSSLLPSDASFVVSVIDFFAYLPTNPFLYSFTLPYYYITCVLH
jgi:hypothetical protein